MSIKRISRTRVATPVTEYVNEDLLATRIGTKVETRAGEPDDTRVGGDVQTKASPAVESVVGGDIQSRVDIRVQTKYST